MNPHSDSAHRATQWSLQKRARNLVNVMHWGSSLEEDFFSDWKDLFSLNQAPATRGPERYFCEYWSLFLWMPWHPAQLRPLPLCRSHSRTVSVTSKDSHSGEPRVCTFLPLRYRCFAMCSSGRRICVRRSGRKNQPVPCRRKAIQNCFGAHI